MIVKLREATFDEAKKYRDAANTPYGRRRDGHRVRKNARLHVVERLNSDGTVLDFVDRPADPLGMPSYYVRIRLSEYEKERALGVLLGTVGEREGHWATVIGRSSRAHFFVDAIREAGPGAVESRVESLCAKWVLGKYGGRDPLKAGMTFEERVRSTIRPVYDAGQRRLTCGVCADLVMRHKQ